MNKMIYISPDKEKLYKQFEKKLAQDNKTKPRDLKLSASKLFIQAIEDYINK